MALRDEVEEAIFPRHRSEGNQLFLLSLRVTVIHLPLVDAPAKPQAHKKKRKGKAEYLSSDHDTITHKKKKSLKAHPRHELNDGYETEVNISEIDQHTRAKKQKTSTGYVAMPLRRTG